MTITSLGSSLIRTKFLVLLGTPTNRLISPIIYGIKVYNKMNGKLYGPYPKGDLWYLYERIQEDGKTVKRFKGKGPLSADAKGPPLYKYNNPTILR